MKSSTAREITSIQTIRGDVCVLRNDVGLSFGDHSKQIDTTTPTGTIGEDPSKARTDLMMLTAIDTHSMRI